MEKDNKKAPKNQGENNSQSSIIIANKTYTVNELNAIFNYNSFI